MTVVCGDKAQIIIGSHHMKLHIDGLVEERCNSSALAMELHLSCTYPSIRNQCCDFIPSQLPKCVSNGVTFSLHLPFDTESMLTSCSANFPRIWLRAWQYCGIATWMELELSRWFMAFHVSLLWWIYAHNTCLRVTGNAACSKSSAPLSMNGLRSMTDFTNMD